MYHFVSEIDHLCSSVSWVPGAGSPSLGWRGCWGQGVSEHAAPVPGGGGIQLGSSGSQGWGGRGEEPTHLLFFLLLQAESASPCPQRRISAGETVK